MRNLNRSQYPVYMLQVAVTTAVADFIVDEARNSLNAPVRPLLDHEQHKSQDLPQLSHRGVVL